MTGSASPRRPEGRPPATSLLQCAGQVLLVGPPGALASDTRQAVGLRVGPDEGAACRRSQERTGGNPEAGLRVAEGLARAGCRIHQGASGGARTRRAACRVCRQRSPFPGATHTSVAEGVGFRSGPKHTTAIRPVGRVGGRFGRQIGRPVSPVAQSCHVAGQLCWGGSGVRSVSGVAVCHPAPRVGSQWAGLTVSCLEVLR